SSLGHHEAAVQVERLAGDARRLGRREEDGHVSDLLRLHHSPLRDLALVVALEDLLAGARAGFRGLHGDAHAGTGVAGTDGVHRDARVTLGAQLGASARVMPMTPCLLGLEALT